MLLLLLPSLLLQQLPLLLAMQMLPWLHPLRDTSACLPVHVCPCLPAHACRPPNAPMPRTWPSWLIASPSVARWYSLNASYSLANRTSARAQGECWPGALSCTHGWMERHARNQVYSHTGAACTPHLQEPSSAQQPTEQGSVGICE